MAKIYSHSKLWLYENCPEAYKIKYIDKKFPDIPKSIELFLGDMVHQSLEWLYMERIKGNEIELDELIDHYLKNWSKNFSNNLRINFGNADEYFNKGIKFLVDYYQKNKPFVENTVETEKRILFDLDETGEYKIQGYVDRIVFNEEEKEYEVHDYKTNNNMKTQEEVDKDRQLAFYHLGVNNLFGKQRTVKLIWHFLSHNATIVSRRNEEQLKRLKEETFDLIKKIEVTKEWPACESRYCDWCHYKKSNGLNNW